MRVYCRVIVAIVAFVGHDVQLYKYWLYIIIIIIYFFVGFARAVESAMKLSTDDQENIGDFDDDIAAEVRAAAATAKSIPMSDQKNAKSPWAPRHDGVPEFVPPPVLQKDNDSYLPNYANNNYINDDAVMNNWMIGITCAIVLACLVGLSLLIISVVRIIRKSDVFKNYKGSVVRVYI